eukprot:2653872-Pyramimonas_sp.AAC.1
MVALGESGIEVEGEPIAGSTPIHAKRLKQCAAGAATCAPPPAPPPCLAHDAMHGEGGGEGRRQKRERAADVADVAESFR